MITTQSMRYRVNGSRYPDQPGHGLALRTLDFNAINTNTQALRALPAEAVSRRAMSWDGIKVEIIQSVTHDKVEFCFRAPRHLLLVHEEGVRDEGETLVSNLPVSSLRALRRKLTFVPAGHEYREWQRPRVRSRVICFYFDPAKTPIDADSRSGAVCLAPLLFFENPMLWETAVKLAGAIEDGAEDQRYCEALAVVVARELLRACGNSRRPRRLARGGLAPWQQRIVATCVEEHLAETIPLTALAKLVDLSPYHFCRAFKQSVGVPPHRYHAKRRIERAKTMLQQRERSVTEIALTLGFSDTSSFSTAFRHTTGSAPTEYRRALG
jgi:AraC family transcriptional regulator